MSDSVKGNLKMLLTIFVLIKYIIYFFNTS